MSLKSLKLAFALARPTLTVNVDLEIPAQGVTAIFGPSGSGKSTLLRSIAGLETPSSGEIRFADTLWFSGDKKINLAPDRRPVGMTFQDVRLFEHRSVMGNLALAERFSRRRQNPNVHSITLDEVIEALDLQDLLQRKPPTLSGGEQRRVGLARTLLSRPALLLLDEPLTGLDTDRKAEILPYLTRALSTFGLPALFISHDIDEVAQLADRVLVLDQGKVKLEGPTTEVIERLELDAFTGRFEAGVLIEGTVCDHSLPRHLTEVDLAGERLSMPLQSSLAIGTSIRLRIRARDVALATLKPAGLSIRNVLPGKLLQLTPESDPGFVDALVQVGEVRIRARLTFAAVEDLQLSAGDQVFVLIKSVSFEGRV
ncbi:MAG: molybdenum ABC transporter ATP-binding protein [Pseudomonadales bacterium]